MTSGSCLLCNSNLQLVLSLGRQAYVNTYLPLDSSQAPSKHPLELCVCTNPNCRHLQLSHQAPPEELFSHYLWVTGTAKTSKAYANKLADSIISSAKEASSIVEIASNDGTFLRPFLSKGLNVLGVEPAKNIASQAINEGIPTICDFFNEKTVSECQKYFNAPPDIILARNVVPHTPNPKEMVAAISKLAGPHTSIFIEVHCFEAIESDLQYDSIYHEHYSYFSAYTLSNLFAQFDLQLVSVRRTDISGGSLFFHFQHKQNNLTTSNEALTLIERSKQLHSPSVLDKFSQRCQRHAQSLRSKFTQLKNQYPHLKFYSFGSSARGNTVLTYTGLSQQLDLCIDSSPLKWHTINASTGLKIVPLADVDTGVEFVLYLAAWNFKDEIIEYMNANGLYPKAILVPFPGQPELF